MRQCILPILMRVAAATALVLVPALGPASAAAADHDPYPESYTEVHRWVPGYTEITPGGDRIHHDGYWVVTRHPRAGWDDQARRDPPDEGSCVGGDVVYAPACPARVVVVAPCPPPACGYGACEGPWRDPACGRVSIAERGGPDGCESHLGAHGGGHWLLPPLPPLPRLSQLPRLPISSLLEALGHLHR